VPLLFSVNLIDVTVNSPVRQVPDLDAKGGQTTFPAQVATFPEPVAVTGSLVPSGQTTSAVRLLPDTEHDMLFVEPVVTVPPVPVHDVVAAPVQLLAKPGSSGPVGGAIAGWVVAQPATATSAPISNSP
jgi:hypothetical protein